MIGVGDYEQKRINNIERNQKLLGSLGLLQKKEEIGSPKRPKDSRPSTKNKKLKAPQAAPLRRSSRNAAKEKVSYKEPTTIELLESDGIEEQQSEEAIPIHFPRLTRPTSKAVAPSPGSSKSLTCDIGMLFGKYLGKEFPTPGKASVMNIACQEKVQPRFSKYSGVVEWRNAIFFWVNIGGKDYANMFLRGGEAITWFAGNRHNPQTPIIRRVMKRIHSRNDPSSFKNIDIVRDDPAKKNVEMNADTKTDVLLGKNNLPAHNGQDEEEMHHQEKNPGNETFEGNSNNEEEIIPELLLMCRLEGQPYVFMGRLEAEKYKIDKLPLEFTWQLKDYATLKDCTKFKHIISAS